MKKRIVDTAISLIEADGSSSFSVAKVAQMLGISQGNLTYHYPKREDLIEAIVDRLISKYTSELEIDSEKSNSEIMSKQVLKFLLSDALQPTMVNTTLFIWENARTNEYVAKALANFYETTVTEHLKFSGYHNSEQSLKAKYALLTIAAVINGIIPILGIAKTPFNIEEFSNYLQSILSKLLSD